MERWNELDAFLDALPEKYRIPGCSCAVAVNGEVVFRNVSGNLDLERTRPLTRDNTFWIYSATKLFTCTAALRLVERGALSLEDPVGKYLPEFFDLTVKQPDGSVKRAENTMLVRHLFTMTGGLDYNIERPTLAALRKAHPTGLTTRQIAGAMAKDPMQFEPGTHYLYSLCHDVLAAVVEVASGMDFASYLDREICRPLGMTDTTFYPTREQMDRLADPHLYENQACRLMWRENRYQLSESYASGGAGLMTTVDDYIRLPAALACGGRAANGYPVLKPETVAMMGKCWLEGEPLRDFKNRSAADIHYGYGLGVRVRTEAAGSAVPVGSFGWDGAAGAYVLVDPVNHLAMFYAQQVCMHGPSYQEIHPILRELACKAVTK